MPHLTIQPPVNSLFELELEANNIVTVYKKDFLFLQILKTYSGC